MFKEGLLEGKRILITGGGTGLGKEIAAKYLQLGAEVWIAGRRGAVLDRLEFNLQNCGGRGSLPQPARTRSLQRHASLELMSLSTTRAETGPKRSSA